MEKKYIKPTATVVAHKTGAIMLTTSNFNTEEAPEKNGGELDAKTGFDVWNEE